MCAASWVILNSLGLSGHWTILLRLTISAMASFLSILYFSIHRYEGGSFWPHLPESDTHAVGRGRGEGYTINVPWNQVGRIKWFGLHSSYFADLALWMLCFRKSPHSPMSSALNLDLGSNPSSATALEKVTE